MKHFEFNADDHFTGKLCLWCDSTDVVCVDELNDIWLCPMHFAERSKMVKLMTQHSKTVRGCHYKTHSRPAKSTHRKRA